MKNGYPRVLAQSYQEIHTGFSEKETKKCVLFLGSSLESTPFRCCYFTTELTRRLAMDSARTNKLKCQSIRILNVANEFCGNMLQLSAHDSALIYIYENHTWKKQHYLQLVVNYLYLLRFPQNSFVIFTQCPCASNWIRPCTLITSILASLNGGATTPKTRLSRVQTVYYVKFFTN